MTVPYGGQAAIYRAIKDHVAAGKIVVDCTSPLGTAVGGRAWHVIRPRLGGRAGQGDPRPGCEDGRRLPHGEIGEQLQDLDRAMDSDVFVCGTDKEAKSIVGELIDKIPDLRWVDAGDLTQARIAETITALLISVNRAYKIHDAGFRVTGRESWGRPGA